MYMGYLLITIASSPLPHVHNVYGEKTNVDQNYPSEERTMKKLNTHNSSQYITILCSVWSDRNGLEAS